MSLWRKLICFLLICVMLVSCGGCRKDAATETLDSATSEPEDTQESAFDAILNGDSGFFHMDFAEEMTIGQYCENLAKFVEADVSVPQYGLADLDADGTAELILAIRIQKDYDYGYLVLRDGHEILGYEFPYRGLMDIKEDGTFHISGGAADNGIARLLFTEHGWEYVTIGAVVENDAGISFFWEGQSVSEDVYLKNLEAQNSKENMEWLPYHLDMAN